jgi:hypothetical protein
MGVFSDIRQALEAKLANLSPMPSCAWPGVAFTPAPGTLFIKPDLVPGITNQHELGSTGPFKYLGVFQVSVFAPPGLGMGAALTQADAIEALFKRAKLTANNTVIYISSVSVGPALPEADWLLLPVSINYFAFAS